MKKLAFALIGLSVVANMAVAGQINWFVPWGVFDHEATQVEDYSKDGIMEKYDVLWQLINAGGDKIADPVDITSTSVPEKMYVSGDDTVLGTRLLSSGDADFDDWLVADQTKTNDQFSDSLVGAYVYQRVFESQQPEAGTYYYETEPVELTNADFVSSTQSLALHDPDWTYGVKPNLVVQGAGSVPEPATMSLLGLGALAMVLRRKLRK